MQEATKEFFRDLLVIFFVILFGLVMFFGASILGPESNDTVRWIRLLLVWLGLGFAGFVFYLFLRLISQRKPWPPPTS